MNPDPQIIDPQYRDDPPARLIITGIKAFLLDRRISPAIRAHVLRLSGLRAEEFGFIVRQRDYNSGLLTGRIREVDGRLHDRITEWYIPKLILPNDLDDRIYGDCCSPPFH